VSVLVFAVPALLSAAVWLHLLLGHGRYWLMDPRLPPDAHPDTDRPRVVAIVPARDEAEVLPSTLPTLLDQDYPGGFRIVLIDDASSDGTGELAEKLALERSSDRLSVLHSDGPPPGWAGKVAAMNRGVAAAEDSEYVLFTDADIAHPADSVRRLAAFAETHRLDLVSLMARLRTETAAERAIVPAFVYSFAQLYPFPRVNRPSARTAAAAGGCMLVRRSALIDAGGLERIADAHIDDVALGRLLKRRGRRSDAGADGGSRIWLGLTTEVRSVRPYPSLADLWDMIARSAYTQLRRSPLFLLGTLIGLLLMYAVPPVLGLAFLPLALGGGNSGGTAWDIATCASSLFAWALISISYLPTLRLYGLRAWRAPLLPAVMMLYGAMTFDSARRHYRGSGGAWKGRVAS